MNSWEFNDIGPDTQLRFYIEFNELVFNHYDDGGEADFQLEGTPQHFQLQARWFEDDAKDRFLQVDWSDIDMTRFTVFPPPAPDGSIGPLGWSWGLGKVGSLCMLIQEKGRTAHIPQNVLPATQGESQPSAKGSATDTHPKDPALSEGATPASKASPSMQQKTKITREQSEVSVMSPAPVTGLEKQWMQYYGDVLGKLCLTELTLPCTHDSGTYQPVSTALQSFIRTQSMSLQDQLNLGIRVLDLRIGQNSPGNYIISHDQFRTQYSLRDALQEIVGFINSTGKEIVILDFHRFNNLGQGDFDFNQLKVQVKSLLEGYCLLPVSQGHTLSKIWQTCGQQRIVVAWNDNGTRDPTYMWPAVKQGWYANAKTPDQLSAAIAEDMRKQRPDSKLWSACVFLAPSVLTIGEPINNAKILTPTIDNWFYGCADWALKANIITTNFFYKFNHTVQASICANILKGGVKGNQPRSSSCSIS